MAVTPRYQVLKLGWRGRRGPPAQEALLEPAGGSGHKGSPETGVSRAPGPAHPAPSRRLGGRCTGERP